jgi:hypothetical protein
VTRVPSDRPGKLEPLAAAERIAGEVRRHVLGAAQASLRALRDLLAKFPSGDAVIDRSAAAETAATVATTSPTTTPRPQTTRDPACIPPPSADLLRSANDLPASYGSDRLVLLARDPHCLYAYWDLSDARVAAVRADGGSEQLRMVLRTYDVTQIAFDAEPPNRFQDFAVTGNARSLYAYLGRPASCFVAEVGYLRPDGVFLPLARSLPIWTPRTDQPGAAPGRWMTVGWSERRDAGELVALGATGTTNMAAPTAAVTEDRPATRQAPSSWPEPSALASQRGSWSIVRGRLTMPAAAGSPTRSDS